MLMRVKKLTPVVIASMLALSLNFIGASQAQAAKCSTKDRLLFLDEESNNINYYTAMASISQGITQDADSYVENAVILLDELIAKTKSKKVKSAAKIYLKEFEKGSILFDWSENPKMQSAQKSLIAIFKFNRC